MPDTHKGQQRMASQNQAKFFFLNHAYLNAYIQLYKGIFHEGGLFLLVSEAGIGKTYLLHKLEKEIPAGIKLAFCYSTNLDYENLLAVICDKLEIIAANGQLETKIAALKEFIIGNADQGIKTVLIIDDAHALGEQVLNDLTDLLELSVPDGFRPRIILSGTTLLEEMLERVSVTHQGGQGVIRIQLEPMISSDVARYISRTIKKASTHDIDSLLSPAAVHKITRYTGGIPRLINLLCERALFIATLNQQPEVSIATIDDAASELVLVEKEIVTNEDDTCLLPDLDQLDETQVNGSWYDSAPERVFDASRFDDKTQGSFDDALLDGVPEVDLDQTVNESVFQTISNFPTTAVSFSSANFNSKLQLVRLGLSSIQEEKDNKETNSYDLIEAKAEKENPGNAVAITQQDYTIYKKKSSSFFQSQAFQWASFIGIAVMAGLVGGFGSVYLFLRSAKPTAPAPQVAASEPSQNAIISAPPASIPGPSDARRIEPETNQPIAREPSASPTAVVSSRETQAVAAVGASSLFQVERVKLPPFFVLAPLSLFESITPNGPIVALWPDLLVAESLSAMPPLETRVAAEPGSTSVANLSKNEAESPAISEPTAATIEPTKENASAVARKSPSREPNVDMAQAALYVSSGDAYLERGDVASARLFYLAAEQSGLPAAMIAVGKTYDPIVLKRLGIKGFAANPDKAVEWYRKAEKVGHAEASGYLKELSQSIAGAVPAAKN